MDGFPSPFEPPGQHTIEAIEAIEAIELGQVDCFVSDTSASELVRPPSRATPWVDPSECAALRRACVGERRGRSGRWVGEEEETLTVLGRMELGGFFWSHPGVVGVKSRHPRLAPVRHPSSMERRFFWRGVPSGGVEASFFSMQEMVV